MSKANRTEIRITGFGGQGVVLAGHIIGHACAVNGGKHATMIQSFGPEARGSACSTTLAVSDTEVLYPYIGRPDIFVVMSGEGYDKYADELKDDGILVYEKDLVKVKEKEGQRSYGVSSTRLAEEIGRAIVQNIVMLGFFAAATEIVPVETMRQAVEESVPKGTEALNLRAFDAGVAAFNESYAKGVETKEAVPVGAEMSKVGVFVCHCGENIARNVKVKDVVDFAIDVPGAAVTADYPYLCSAPGQQMVIDAIREHGLDRVVIAACSPQLHEPTFRAAAAQAGLNPHLVEIANIREHCSWVHRDPDEASAKACQTVTAAVERVKRSKPLDPVEVPVTKRALVIGGGVAGIRTALDIANSGHPVVLVEREPSLGGNMSRLSETFPTLDCSQCILTPLMVQVSRHPLIELMTYSEVEGVSGYVGNFTVSIRKKPPFVDPDVCTACGDCTEVCPSPGSSEFDMGLSTRKAIYIPFPQAVPSTYTLDADRCLNSNLQSPTGFRVLACVKCDEVCKPQAINFDMQPEIVERQVGAIIVATGYDLQIGQQAKECGYGELPNVMDGLEFERMLSASGPTDGEVRRPSDGAEPKDVVFIQCVGSRNPKHGVPYCSRICCMYTAKHALLLRHKVPESRAFIFYMDIRAGGKGYEEFVHRAMEEERVMYIRGRVSQVYEEDGKLKVMGVDTLSGKQVEIDADMVVLATAMEPTDHGKIASTLRIATDTHGFLKEAHPKLRPVETLTAGIFLAGAAQAPKDIPDTVSQASAAASKGMELLSHEFLERDPSTASINQTACAGCFECLQVCPYGAIEQQDVLDRDGNVVRMVAWSNPAMCEGCGLCAVTCRGGFIDVAGYNDEQVFAQLGALGPLPEVFRP